MRILLFTNSSASRSGFDKIQRSRLHTLEVHDPKELKRIVPSKLTDAFVYLDITGMSIGTIQARLKYLAERVGPHFGVVDPKNALPDVAEAFHRGASDYVDSRLLREKISTARLTRVATFAAHGDEAEGEHALAGPVGRDDIRPSGVDWLEIDPGKEYTFQMVYVGLDHVKEIRRKSSDELIQGLRKTLQNLLTRAFGAVQGRIWVWKEDDGVLLCPFDGERVTAIVPAMRLVLNRTLIAVEQFRMASALEFRTGLHIGNTTYRASGQTSAIVSESLNFVFHLGQRALSAGQFGITGEAYSLLSERTRDCFSQGPVFESTDLYLFRELA